MPIQRYLLVFIFWATSAVWNHAAIAQETPPARQFDFWIGQWNVVDVNGKQLGTNQIESILDGKALQESWKGAGGSVGRSLNCHSNGKWHQTWVDNQGSLLLLDGEFKDGKMVLEGQTSRGAKKIFHRITWQPLDDGRVKQHWQQSADQKNWTDAFVGYYVRKPEVKQESGR